MPRARRNTPEGHVLAGLQPAMPRAQEKTRQKGYLFHHLDGETLEALERIRVPQTGKETQ